MIEVTKPRAIALGYFDGVHLGHRALMQRAVERAKQIGGTSAVFTFDVHPDSVVMGRQVPLLTANAYRTEEIKKLGGVDEVIFGHFDHEMQHMDWRDFIHKLLIGRFNAGWIISGRNNRFGYKGQGNAEGMAIECEKAGIGYDCIEDVKIDGIVVSSTYIRQLISQGDMQALENAVRDVADSNWRAEPKKMARFDKDMVYQGYVELYEHVLSTLGKGRVMAT